MKKQTFVEDQGRVASVARIKVAWLRSFRRTSKLCNRHTRSLGGPKGLVAVVLAVATIAIVLAGLLDVLPGSKQVGTYSVPQLIEAYEKYLIDKTNRHGRLSRLPDYLLNPLLIALTRFIPVAAPHTWGNASDIYQPDNFSNGLAFLMPLRDDLPGKPPIGCKGHGGGMACVDWLKNVSSELLRRDPAASSPTFPLNYLFLGFWGWFNYISPNGGTFTSHNTLLLTQLYGDTPARARALRTMQSGKLKTSICADGEVCLPLLRDLQPDFTMVTNSTLQQQDSTNQQSEPSTPGVDLGSTVAPLDSLDSSSSLDAPAFASGDPNTNLLSGKIFWSTMFVRLHNQMCDLVSVQHPEYSDEQLFQNARLLVSHVVVKIMVEDVISNVLSPLREYVQLLRYDLDELRSLPVRPSPWRDYWEHKLWTSWYSAMPQTLTVTGDQGSGAQTTTDMPFKATLFWPALVAKLGPTALGQGAYQTPLHPFGPNSIPGYFTNTTIGLLAVADTMKLRYNDYLRLLGLPPITSFHQLRVSSSTIQTLDRLYASDVNQLDMPVGMWLQRPKWSKCIVSEPMLVGIMGFTLSSILNLQLIQNPSLWEDRLLTPLGKKFVQEFKLSNWLGETIGIDTPCPFFHPSVRCPWISLPEPPNRWHLANLGDFVFINMQALKSNILLNSECLHRQYLLVFVMMLGIVFGFVTLHWLLSCISRVYRRLLVPSRKLQLIIQVVMALTFAVQLGPYTKLILQLLIGPDALATMNRCCVGVLVMPMSHALLFSVQSVLVVLLKRDPLMLIRRVGFGGMMIIAISSQSFMLMKVALVLDYFLLHKVSLYVVYILRALRLRRKWLLPCMVFGLLHYISTRLLQMGVIVAIFMLSLGKVGSSQLDFYGAAVVTCVWVVVQWQEPVSLAQSMQRMLRSGRRQRGWGEREQHSTGTGLGMDASTSASMPGGPLHGGKASSSEATGKPHRYSSSSEGMQTSTSSVHPKYGVDDGVELTKHGGLPPAAQMAKMHQVTVFLPWHCTHQAPH